MFPSLEVRSYQQESPRHRHDFAQWVLPVRGRMDIDVDGRGGWIDPSRAALVPPGSMHSQDTQLDGRFLVLDCAPQVLETLPMQRLARQIYLPVSPATRRLIEFAELIGNQQLSLSALQLAPLLLASMGAEIAGISSPLDRLIARLRANPGAGWNNEAMAKAANMSLSQLHLRFRELFAMSPQAWLTDLRISEAQRWLRGSALPIAEIALRTGFSDQAALTRTMQRVSAITPAAYRRAQNSLGKKSDSF